MTEQTNRSNTNTILLVVLTGMVMTILLIIVFILWGDYIINNLNVVYCDVIKVFDPVEYLNHRC